MVINADVKLDIKESTATVKFSLLTLKISIYLYIYISIYLYIYTKCERKSQNTTPRCGHHPTHAHSHITWTVAVLVGEIRGYWLIPQRPLFLT